MVKKTNKNKNKKKETFFRETWTASETNAEAKILKWLLWIYASAVVGKTLTKRVLVSKAFTDESAGSSEKHRNI